MSYVPPIDLARRPRAPSTCGLCRRAFGSERPRTKDHVVPDGFFGQPKPPNLPTWPVCGPCQVDLAPREDRLRSLFARAHSHHPEEVAHVRDTASRSTQQPAGIGRRLVTTPSGLHVPVDIAAPRPADLDRVFTKIATGLFWWRTGALPASARFAVRLMSSDDFAHWSRTLSQPVQRLGAEFWWMTALDESDLAWGVWLFVIFGAVPVGVWHGEMATMPGLPALTGVALRDGGALG